MLLTPPFFIISFLPCRMTLTPHFIIGGDFILVFNPEIERLSTAVSQRMFLNDT